MKQKRKLGRKLLSFLLTLVMALGQMPGMSLTAYATSYDSLNVETVLHVGDSINSSTEYKLSNAVFLNPKYKPWTLVRANISGEDDVQESETGAYYLFKGQFSSMSIYQKDYKIAATSTSDGIYVTSVGSGTSPLVSFAVHEAPAHTHSFTYAASGATITATCRNTDGNCTLPPSAEDGTDHITTLTIGAPSSLSYDGNAKSATITDTNNIKGDATVSYYKATKSGDTYTKSSGPELNSAPVNVGDYIAEITIGGATAFVGYSITKQTNTTGQISTETLSGNITESNTSITIGSTSLAYEYIVVEKDATPDWAGATPGTGNAMTFDGLSAGTGYDVYVRAKGDDNTEPGEATKVTLTTNVTVTITGTPIQGQGGITVTTDPVKTGVTYRWYIGDNTDSDGTGTTIVPSQGGGILKVEVLLDGEVIGTQTTGTTTVKTLAEVITDSTTSPVEITLDGPVKGGISIPADKHVELELNGQEVSGDITVPAGSTLTIDDTSDSKTGTVKGAVAANTGTIIIKGGRYDTLPTANDPGIVTIEGGLFENKPVLGNEYGIKEGEGEHYNYQVLPKPTVTSEPHKTTSVDANLTYNGSAQVLVTAGTVENATVYFAIGNDETNAPAFDGTSTAVNKKWTTSVPTGKEAGTYHVWYRIVGNATHADLESKHIAVKILPAPPKVTDLRANPEVFDYTTGVFKNNNKYEIYVGTSMPDASADTINVDAGGYDLLTNIVDADVNNDTDTSNDKKLYVRMVDGEDKSDWVYIPLPKRQSTSGIAVDYNKDTISGMRDGIWYTTNETDPTSAQVWKSFKDDGTVNHSTDLTLEPVAWNGSAAKTLKFMVPGAQDNQLFPSKVATITLGAKGTAPTKDDLDGYTTQGGIPDEKTSYRNADLPTSTDSRKKLQYRYKKNGTSDWTSWGSSNKAIGLDMGTKYDFEVRFAPETDQNGRPTGPASLALFGTFTTKITKPDINDILDRYIDYSTKKFANPPTDTYEYASTADAETWIVCANGNDVPGGDTGFYIRYKNAGNGQPSAATFIPAATIPADVNAVIVTDEEVKGLGGSFSGTGNTMEYRYRVNSSHAWTTWIPCTSNMTGLAAGDYQIRKKASGSGNPSFARQLSISAGYTATITVTVKDKDENNIDYATVKAAIAGNAGSTNSTNNQNGTYTITGLSAGTYQIIATGTDGHEVTTLLTITSVNHAVNITLPTGKENSSKLVDNTGNNIAVGGIDEQAKALDTKSGETDKEYLVSFKAEEKSEADSEIADEINGINSEAEADATYRDSENKPVDVQKEFLDFSVEKTLMSNADSSGSGVGDTTKITKTDRVMEIIYPYPEMNTRFGIMVWRYHDSVQKFSRLESRPTTAGAMRDATYYIDRLEKRLYIYGNLFSTYSITYAENADIKDPDTGNPGGGGTGGGGGETPTPPTPTYKPTITQPEHGTITVVPTLPRSGQNVVITVTPEDGYETDEVIVKDKNGNTVPVTKNSDGTYSFTQPSTGEVTIEAVVTPVKDRTPIINEPEHGTVVVSPEKPEANDIVTITVTPEDGYEVDSVVVTDKDGNPVTVTKNADGTYSFVQPASGSVTITPVLRLTDGVIITFNLNGKTGTAPDAQTVKKGEKAVRPKNPVAEGYKFTGWFTDKECKNAYDFNAPVNEDLILYAGWKTKEEPGEDDFGIYFVELFDDPYDGVSYNAELDRYEIVYTGAAINPLIRVSSKADGDLKEGIDYSVSYSNNKNVSKPNKPATIKVSGKGFYKSNKVLELYILQADLEEAMDKGLIAGADELKVLSGQKLNPVLVYRGYKLTSKDRDISNKNKITADTTTDITGKGNFTGTLKDVTVKVISKAEQKKNAIKVNLKAETHVYNGESVELKVTTADAAGELTVTAGSSKTPLAKDTDFLVSYSRNISAGKATVTIKGIGSYNGTVVKHFTIQTDKAVDITTQTADPDKPIYYNVRGAMPGITVTAHRSTDEILKEGRDYLVSYSSNKKVGKGSYIVKFIGNYKGHKAVKGTFDIVQAPMDKAKVEATQMIYKKPGKYLSKPYVSLDGVQLKTSDYTYKYYIGEKEITSKTKLSLAEGENSKTVRIVVTGKGNYTNTTAEGTYEVVRRGAGSIDLTKAKIVAKDKKNGKDVSVAKQEYTGYEIEPEIRVMVKVNKKWVDVDPADYTVSYINNVNKGTATILLTGDGEKVVGSKTARFSISTMRFDVFKLIFG